MAYSDFSFTEVKKRFKLTYEEKTDLFSTVQEVGGSLFLQETLKYNTPLALTISTEKVRSELIVAPVLLEIVKRSSQPLSFYSGTEFTVNREQGLNGVCDFVICKSKQEPVITAPILIAVEAKNDNLNNGLGQCIATMYAANEFNKQENLSISAVYGVITTGSNWKFFRLENTLIQADPQEYFIDNLDKILGILWHIVEADSTVVV
jgi:hypothetical protein